MAQPMQQQEHVVRAVFDRHGMPKDQAAIAGRFYRVGDAIAAVTRTIEALDTEDAR